MTRPILSFLLAAILAVSATTAVAAETSWERIDVPGPFVDNNGVERFPSCSGGPEPDGDSPAQRIPTMRSSSVRATRRNSQSSLTAAAPAGMPTPASARRWPAHPIYSQTVDETVEGLNASEGLGDFENPENPIADYTQVFIPYCTGDLHTGASDTEYSLQLNLVRSPGRFIIVAPTTSPPCSTG